MIPPRSRWYRVRRAVYLWWLDVHPVALVVYGMLLGGAAALVLNQVMR